MSDREELFANSVVVTGTHYSMSTLTGKIIGQAPEFHVVYEPLNAEPSLSYASLNPEHWYEYYNGSRYDRMRAALYGYAYGAGAIKGTLGRLPRIHSARDVLRVGKYAWTNLAFRCRPRRVVFKDPFLAFSGAELQARDGLYVVLSVRHPCGFAESLKRRGRGFDFNNLSDQPALLEAMPDMAELIKEYAATTQPIVAQAALLWRVIYDFSKRNMLSNPRTIVLRQEDLVANPTHEVQRVLDFLEATCTDSIQSFIRLNLEADSGDFIGGSYVRRNARAATEKWRERLSAHEIALVMEIVGQVAQAYGYTDPSPSLEPTSPLF